MKIFYSRLAVSILIALAVAIVFRQSIHENFVWDDDSFMNLSNLYQGGAGIRNAFTKNFILLTAYYRPVVISTFALIGHDANGGALTQHIFNLFLHISSSILIFLCCLEIMLQRKKYANKNGKAAENLFLYVVSFFCAIIYATHPLTVESVAWVSGRFDLMLTFFLLLFIYIDLTLKDGTVFKWVSLFLTYFLAAGSKEMAVMLPFVLPFIYLLIHRNSQIFEIGSFICFLKQKIWTFSAIASAGLLYLALRIYALGSLFPEISTTVSFRNDCLLCSPMYFARSILEFMRLVFLPAINSGPLYPYDFPSGPKVIISGILICIALLIFAIYFARKNNLAIPFLIFVIVAFPVLNLIRLPIGDQLISSRFALAPFALFLITLFPVWSKPTYKAILSLHKPTIFIIVMTAVFWICANIFITMHTIPLWRTNNSIYTYMYEIRPESSYARKFYINILLSQGRNEEVRRLLGDLMAATSRGEVKIEFHEALQIAALNMNIGDYEEAKKIVTTLLRSEEVQGENFALGQANCALMSAEIMMGNFEQAVIAGEISMEHIPDRIYCRILYADALYKSGRISDALQNKEIVMSNSLATVRDEMQRISSHWKSEEPAEQ